MDLLAHEIPCAQPGQQTLLDRLLDVALVQILREHFTTEEASAPGWFRGSSDPRIGAALRALHSDPAHPWTVAELAEHALLSRSAFARRFHELLGVAPLTYLNDWRMALARERLRDTDARLAAISQSLGYSSEFSFAAAFKRHHGIAPGRWRAQTRRAAAAACSCRSPRRNRRAAAGSGGRLRGRRLRRLVGLSRSTARTLPIHAPSRASWVASEAISHGP